MESIHLKPKNDESPSSFSKRLGELYADSVSKDHKKKNGQFFTPLEIAHFMAAYFNSNRKELKILDPGTGVGILSCALVEKIIANNKLVRKIELVVYEIDKDVIPLTIQSLEYLLKFAAKNEVVLTYEIRQHDFILHNAHCFRDTSGDLFYKETEVFDIIISNPPYFKLAKTDLRAVAASTVYSGHANIYSIFMALSAILLKNDGQLIFITPRSYASGGYFKVFRSFFFKKIQLKNVHLFVSRKDTFSRDKVLQETVIINGFKQDYNLGNQTEISSSSGIVDIDNARKRTYSSDRVLDLNTDEKIMYLPTSDYEEHVLSVFRTWRNKFIDYEVKVSTGPVVAFRSKEYLRSEYQNSNVYLAPLYWLHNIKPMEIEWPIVKPKKEQYINIEPLAKPLLVPNKNYVLLRRFSSKDDKNRLVAAPYLQYYKKAELIGLENKVNYIYRPGGELSNEETVGIAALLSSTIYDTYFRIFNGNVNVSATELKEMTLPDLEVIQNIGSIIIESNNFTIDFINELVNNQIELELTE